LVSGRDCCNGTGRVGRGRTGRDGARQLRVGGPIATCCVVPSYGSKGRRSAAQCAYYLWSALRNAAIYEDDEAKGTGKAVGADFYKKFNCINVFGDKPWVRWGEGWQELRRGQTFAKWYLTVNNWHAHTANTLRQGMGGVQHMQQRLQHMEVQLAQAEQALQATHRLRQQEQRAAQVADERVEEQAEILSDLEAAQQAALEASRAEKEMLENKLKDLESRLEDAIQDKAKFLQEDHNDDDEDSRESVAALEQSRAELAALQQDFVSLKDAADMGMRELHTKLEAQRTAAAKMAEQKVEVEHRVKQLEQQLNQKHEEMSGEAAQAAPHSVLNAHLC